MLVGDYVRQGYYRYKPRPEEVELMWKRSCFMGFSLQYALGREIRLIVKNCPVCIDGTQPRMPRGKQDLERIGTNRVRGMCTCKGSLKRKVKKHVRIKHGWMGLAGNLIGVMTRKTTEKQD